MQVQAIPTWYCFSSMMLAIQHCRYGIKVTFVVWKTAELDAPAHGLCCIVSRTILVAIKYTVSNINF